MGSRVSINFKETAINAINGLGKTRLGRVQRAEIGANLPTTPVQELGSDQIAGRIFDLPEVTVTVSSMDVGVRTKFALAGVDWTAVPSGSSVEAQDIDYVCLEQPFKAARDSDEIVGTLFVPGAKLERFSLNYSVGGDSTEEFSFNATNRYFLKYDVAVASGTVDETGLFTFTSPVARVLKNGSYVLSAFASGLGYLPREAITSSTSTSVTFDTETVADDTPVTVMYHADLSNQWDYTYEFPHVAYGATPLPDQPVGVRGWGVEIWLVDTASGVEDRVYRVQTCTVQGQFPNTRINELGSEEVVGYMDSIPEITGTLELLLHDFKIQKQLSANDVDGDNWTPNDLGDSTNWGLEIRVFRRGVDRNVVGPEETIWIPKLDITQEQNNTQVGQDARVTYNFASRSNKIYFYKGEKSA